MAVAPPRWQAFLADLERRRVFRVTVLYCIAAFGVMQVANEFFPPLGLPPWTQTLVAVLCLLGLPVAVVLAYTFDITPKGVRRTRTAAPASSIPNLSPGSLSRRVIGSALALVLLVGAAWASYRVYAPQLQIDRSIAVLPFTNMSAAASDEYFSDGMMEDILTNLSKVGDLRVISRTSVMPYKQTDKSIRQIGEELGVAYLLEGSVRREEGRLRITAQLIDARTDKHLWAENYDSDAASVFAVQSEIAQKIAGELGARLSRAERRQIEMAPTEDPEVYDLVLRGREYMHRGQKDATAIAMDFFKQAIAKDPGLAVAHALLAATYVWQVNRFGEGPEWLDSATVAAERALVLNPQLIDGHVARASADLNRGRYSSGCAGVRKAVALNANHGSAVGNLAFCYAMLGQYDEVVRWSERAMLLDPAQGTTFSINKALAYAILGLEAPAEKALQAARALRPDYPHIQLAAVHIQLLAGRATEAVETAEQSAEAHPNITAMTAYAGEAHLFAGHSESARPYLEGALAMSTLARGFAHYVPVLLGFSHWREGERVVAEELFGQFEAFAREEIRRGSEAPGPRYSLAAVHATRGDHAEALHWLKEAVAAGWLHHGLIIRDPLLANLRGNPEFQRVIAGVAAELDRQRAIVVREGL
jgi:TolB-like protein/Tfp pilus assembly protein PilF